MVGFWKCFEGFADVLDIRVTLEVLVSATGSLESPSIKLKSYR